MKGIYVINSLEGGGAERVFSSLVTLISEDIDNSDIEVILLDKKNESYLLPSKIVVHRIGMSNPISSFFKYLKIVKKIKPDYVVSFLTRANQYNVFGTLFTQYKSLISERSNTSNRLNGRFKKIKKFLVTFLYNKADCIISVSKGVEDCLVNDFKIDRNKMKLLNNAINIEKVTKLAETSEKVHANDYIVAMGRLVKTKGFSYLIKAYAKANLSSDLLILGDGPEKTQLKELAIELKVQDKVHFKGFQANPYPYIKQSQFFVLSSELEGFPNALVEALGLGKAVLATDCTDGPSEILNLKQKINLKDVVKAQYGLLVNIRDEEALAKGLLMFEQDTKLKNKYEQQSILCAQQFSPENFYNNYKGILKKYV